MAHIKWYWSSFTIHGILPQRVVQLHYELDNFARSVRVVDFFIILVNSSLYCSCMMSLSVVVITGPIGPQVDNRRWPEGVPEPFWDLLRISTLAIEYHTYHKCRAKHRFQSKSSQTLTIIPGSEVSHIMVPESTA